VGGHGIGGLRLPGEKDLTPIITEGTDLSFLVEKRSGSQFETDPGRREKGPDRRVEQATDGSANRYNGLLQFDRNPISISTDGGNKDE
jgi:hypothetical protein